MSTKQVQFIVLAAGRGSRMESDLPKVLHKVQGRSLLRWILDSINATRFAKSIIIVISYKGHEVRKHIGESYQYVEQGVRRGTAAAALACTPYLDLDTNPPVVICMGDQPFISARSLEALVCSFLSRRRPAIVLGTTQAPDFHGPRATFRKYGRVVRDAKGQVTGIVESEEVTSEQRKVREVYTGFMCIGARELCKLLPGVLPNATSEELHLPDIVKSAVKAGKRIETVSFPLEEALGINTQVDLRRAKTRFLARTHKNGTY